MTRLLFRISETHLRFIVVSEHCDFLVSVEKRQIDVQVFALVEIDRQAGNIFSALKEY